MESVQIKIAAMKQADPSDHDNEAEMPQAIPNAIPAVND
jgi:hypothetical protein